MIFAAGVAIFAGKFCEIGVVANELHVDLRPLGIGIFSLVHDGMLTPQPFAPIGERGCAEIEEIRIAEDLRNDVRGMLGDLRAHDRFFNDGKLRSAHITSDQFFRLLEAYEFMSPIDSGDPNIVHPGANDKKIAKIGIESLGIGDRV